MKNCNDIKHMLSLYLDNELHENDRKEVVKHLEKCNDCKNELDIYKNIMDSFGELDEVELPKDYHTQLHYKLVEAKKDLSQKSTWLKVSHMRWIGSVAAGLVVLFVGLNSNYFENVFNKSMQAYVNDANLNIIQQANSSTSKQEKKNLNDTKTKNQYIRQETLFDEAKTANTPKETVPTLKQENITPKTSNIPMNTKLDSTIPADQKIAANKPKQPVKIEPSETNIPDNKAPQNTAVFDNIPAAGGNPENAVNNSVNNSQDNQNVDGTKKFDILSVAPEEIHTSDATTTGAPIAKSVPNTEISVNLKVTNISDAVDKTIKAVKDSGGEVQEAAMMKSSDTTNISRNFVIKVQSSKYQEVVSAFNNIGIVTGAVQIPDDGGTITIKLDIMQENVTQ